MNTHSIDTTTVGPLRRRPGAAGGAEPPSVLPQHEKLLRDAFGAPLRDGSCVLDPDHRVGYVRLEFGTRRGPDSPYWDGWFSVTPTRGAHPLSGKVVHGSMVNLIGRAS